MIRHLAISAFLTLGLSSAASTLVPPAGVDAASWRSPVDAVEPRHPDRTDPWSAKQCVARSMVKASGADGTLRGTVTRALDGTPIVLASVEIYSADSTIGVVETDADGVFVASGLEAGTYFVSAQAADHRGQIHDGIECTRVECHGPSGTPIDVAAGEDVSGIDFELTGLGRLTGRLTEVATGEPVSSQRVEIRQSDGLEMVSAETDDEGRYEIRLWPGTYFAFTATFRYWNELYDGVRCPPGPIAWCTTEGGTPIEIAFDTTTSGIDFVLDRPGTLSGRVFDASDGSPIDLANVTAWNLVTNEHDNLVVTDGHYSFRTLLPGDYVLTASAPAFASELYEDLACIAHPQTLCELAQGTPVSVEFNTTTTGIDFGLDPGGQITGRVLAADTAEPLAGIVVFVVDAFGGSSASATTDQHGVYSVRVRGSGTYFAYAIEEKWQDGSFYQGQVYDGRSCAPGQCDPLTGDPIDVVQTLTTTGIDFELVPSGAIEGRITDVETDSGLVASIVADGDTHGGTTVSDVDGTYRIDGLPAGEYTVVARSPGYIGTLYPAVPCHRADCDVSAGRAVATAVGSVTSGIDIALPLGGSLSGSVTLHSDVSPIWIQLFDAQGVLVDQRSFLDPESFRVGALEAGSYFVKALAARHRHEIFQDTVCFPDCDPTIGHPVQVQLGEHVAGIDFALEGLGSPCQPSTTVLCLNRGRFRVQATWHNADGVSDVGRVHEVTADTGYLWFFDEDNVEVVVKVLDACIAPYSRFWVFAAGLTDVDVQLTVTDVASGEVRTYDNMLGKPFATILDTDAFATCGSVPSEPYDRPAEPARDGR